MCGIAGIFQFQSQSSSAYRVTDKVVTRMRDEMEHRGPDGAGLWQNGKDEVWLAHRRLAILDLSEKASQPMVSEDGQVAITFNGEIYNHAELRKQLISQGVTEWVTDHSDTEVVLRGYLKWGIAVLDRLRGMFGIGIWDGRWGELYLVRDRIGIKPVYYTISHGQIRFASEIKALLTVPWQARAMNERAMFHYLSFLTTPAPQTLFDGIKKLEGGTFLRIKRGGQCEIKRYWELWDHVNPITEQSHQAVSEQVLDSLRESVAYRKVSDVPVGVFLSGGIDSSTNAALFSENASEPVSSYSIGYAGEYESYTNELHYAQQMAETLGSEWHKKSLTQEDLISFLPHMIHLQDEPIADPVCVPVYYVSELAKQNGMTVCHVGEGADELFWGYQGWKTSLNVQLKNDMFGFPGANQLKQMGCHLLALRGRQRSTKYEYLRRLGQGIPVFWGGAEAFYEYEKHELLSDRLKQEMKGYTSWEALKPIYKRFSQGAWDKHPLNWMSYLDLNLRLPELLLMRVDKMSMGVSLEARVPFLDHEFVQLAMSIPATMKTHEGNSKTVLKRAVRGLIPDELIDRKKQGFGVPVYEWFYDRLGEMAKKTVVDFCDQTDYLDKRVACRVIQENQGHLGWYIYNLALWWQHHIAEQPCESSVVC